METSGRDPILLGDLRKATVLHQSHMREKIKSSHNKLASLEGLLKKGLCEDKLVIFIVIISPSGAFWRILSDLSGSCPMDIHEVKKEGVREGREVASVTRLMAVLQGWPHIYPQMFKSFLNIITILVWCHFLFLLNFGKQGRLRNVNAHFSPWKTW